MLSIVTALDPLGPPLPAEKISFSMAAMMLLQDVDKSEALEWDSEAEGSSKRRMQYEGGNGNANGGRGIGGGNWSSRSCCGRVAGLHHNQYLEARSGGGCVWSRIV